MLLYYWFPVLPDFFRYMLPANARLESVFKIDLHVDDRLVAQPTMYSVQAWRRCPVNQVF